MLDHKPINDPMLAYAKGKELGEHHPLTVYIQAGDYIVNDGPGRPVLFCTSEHETLGAFMDGHREAHLAIG